MRKIVAPGEARIGGGPVPPLGKTGNGPLPNSEMPEKTAQTVACVANGVTGGMIPP